MGLLGLDTVYFLSDRIFSILDEKREGKVTVFITLDRLSLKNLFFISIRSRMETRWRRRRSLMDLWIRRGEDISYCKTSRLQCTE